MKTFKLLSQLFPLFLVLLTGCKNIHPNQDTSLENQVSLRYTPENNDFVILNGTKRFNRALYGTNTGFRVETGDLPEMAMYLPGMGGNLKFGLVSQDSSKWLIDGENIVMRYRPGTTIYEITDPLLKKGKLTIQVLALAGEEGMIVKVAGDKIPGRISLAWAFGGANGKRFHREGDLGADPESVFYLQPEYCRGNKYEIESNTFTLTFDSQRDRKTRQIRGVSPPGSILKVGSAKIQGSPGELLSSEADESPVLTGIISLSSKPEHYFVLSLSEKSATIEYSDTEQLFLAAENSRQAICNRIRINTPDPFINTYGASLAIAADGIWEDPAYLHGAVAWRMHLAGWRGAYAADWLGWHDRAETHLKAYALSQYTKHGDGKAAPDPNTHLSRQKEEEGKSIYNNGYISRYPGRTSKPHHYDMNLVYMDQLLWHLQWTGDLEFAKEMWPVIQRHLDWEKRSFDANNDGLYDAYACIWASDALQYSGGGVTHSTAYNYRANQIAATVAGLIGEDPDPYLAEAEKIKTAVNRQLWMADKGWYAEFIDLLGLQRQHPAPAIWTIYHALDSDLPDAFQSWQSMQYVTNHIPHLPLDIKELPGEEYYTISTSNWMPYEWSINNVALSENFHTSLAYWQANDNETAFKLWKSQVMESMYLGGSPGNFQQLSQHDVFRGELYRDFADPVGTGSRTLVEGLFGFKPDLLNNKIVVEPGLPAEWGFARLETPDFIFDYKQKGLQDTYSLSHHFTSGPDLLLRIPARGTTVRSLTVNGEEVGWTCTPEMINKPKIELELPYAENYLIKIEWGKGTPEVPKTPQFLATGEKYVVKLKKAAVKDIFDPQGVLSDTKTGEQFISGTVNEKTGPKTFFVKLRQEDMEWWSPVDLEVRDRIELIPAGEQNEGEINYSIRNNTKTLLSGSLYITGSQEVQLIKVPGESTSEIMDLSDMNLVPGTNKIVIKTDSSFIEKNITSWNRKASKKLLFQTVDLSGFFNDMVTNIFKNEYLEPRSPYPTLQLPVQGMGDWCSYKKYAEIDDSGLRDKAGASNLFSFPQGIPVTTPGDPAKKNILFTSLWNNYPDSISIPLEGPSSHAYMLMAGSTHHMQSRIINGLITFYYTDGSKAELELINPDTWWPIEQDYYRDNFAFQVDGVKPPRLHLKTGEVPDSDYQVLAVNKTIMIDGGAATLLDLPLDSEKELESVCLKTLSNDVVIGLMGITLVK